MALPAGDGAVLISSRAFGIVLEHSEQEVTMSKGMDQKKSKKKEPEKSLKEKRAAKQEKKKK